VLVVEIDEGLELLELFGAVKIKVVVIIPPPPRSNNNKDHFFLSEINI
jgi:hypothetical protein